MIPNQYPSLDFELGETADMLRDSVMSFAGEKIAPLAEKVDLEGWCPHEIWAHMTGLHMYALPI